MMSLLDSAEREIVGTAFKRVLVSGVNLAAANLAAYLAAKIGVHVQAAEIVSAVFLGLEALRHYVVVKYPIWNSLLS